MAFTPSTLSVILQTIGGVGMRFVSYRSDDTIATLTGTDYFARGTDYGLRLHDLIFVSPVSGTAEPYVLVGTAVDSEGNVTATQTAFDAELTVLAGLDKSDGNFIVGNGTTWVAESGATARASLGLTIGTDVQAYDADLSAIAALAKTDGNFIVGDGSTWVAESGNTATNSLTFTQGVSGDTTRTVLEFIREGRTNVCDLTVPSDGTSNASAGLKRAFERGGALWVPEGVYNIPAENTTDGGVLATLTKSLDILCHPNAKFVAGLNLQANPLRFTVPSGGTDLPNEGIIFKWEGGRIDVSLACNPTSVLWTAFYDRYRPGGTGSRAALSPYGAFESGGEIYSGIKLAHIVDVDFYAGDHWITAGGDNLYGAGEGIDNSIVERCRFRGSRGTAIYGLPAWTDDTPPYKSAGGKIIIRDCVFDDCAGGMSLKQSVDQFLIENNLVRNAPSAYGIAGSGIHDLGSGGVIRNNRAEYVTRLMGIQNARGVTAYNNTLANAGALDNAGNALTLLTGAGPTATICVFEGMQHCDIEKVIFLGKSTEHSSTTFKMYYLGHYAHTDTTTYPSGYVKSTHNKLVRGYAKKDMADLGSEASGEAEYNTFEENLIVGGSSLLTAIENTSKWVAPKAGVSFSYRDTSTAAHTGTTAATTVKSATIVAAEVPIGSSFRVRSVFDPSGTNGTKTIKAIVGANLITVSSQTSGEAQDSAMHLIISRVSSTGYTVEGWYGEEGGTSDVIPFNLFALSGNFDVGVEVTLGHVDDTVSVYGLIIEPM